MPATNQRLFLSACCISVGWLATAQPAAADENDEFLLAAAKGDAAQVRRLLSQDPTLVNHRFANDFTPLFEAALAGQTAVVKLLLEQGAKVDAPVLGETPLFRACMNGSSETATVLLDHGASLSLANDRGETPLDVAIDRLHPGTVQLLLDRGADPNLSMHKDRAGEEQISLPLHEAVEEVALTLQWKARYEQKGDEAQVARYERLLKAAEKIARMLIEHDNVDVNARRPGGGGTALHTIASCGHVELAGLLLDHGADVNSTSLRRTPERRRPLPYHQTPLHLAVKNGHKAMVEFLLQHGADREARDSTGATPFQVNRDRPPLSRPPDDQQG